MPGPDTGYSDLENNNGTCFTQCYGIAFPGCFRAAGSVTLNAGGANTYAWSPVVDIRSATDHP